MTTFPRFHMGLLVRDLEASVAFYDNLFAMSPTKLREGYAKYEVADPSINFTLNRGEVDGRGTLSHFGIQLGDHATLERHRDRLAAVGLLLREEKATTCCYAEQDKFWVTDPDGNEIEFFLVLGDAEARDTAGAINTPGAAETVSRGGCC